MILRNKTGFPSLQDSKGIYCAKLKRIEDPMNSSQIRTVFITIAIVLAAWAASPLLFSFREQTLPLSNAPIAFSESEAYQYTQEFVTQFPHRVLGSIESRQSTGYLHDHLQPLGYVINYSHFDARIAWRRQVGRNVLAYKQGKSSETLALVAHLDTAKTAVQGAMDNGSGVGVLLELAKIFSAIPTNRSLLIIFSDGEEWGMLGARDLATTYPERNRIAVVLSLDHVGIGDLAAFNLGETGQSGGFTPPWLRMLVHRAAELQGLSVYSPSGFSEFLERALLISRADQGPFLSAGFPAINLGSESKERSREKQVYHSAQDTVDQLNVESIGKYGRAAERIVRTLDALPLIPHQSSNSFRAWDALFIKSSAISTLQIASFLPLVLAFWFCLMNCRGQLSRVLLGREFLAFLGTVLPFWLIYFLIELASALRQIPAYTLYPATVKDPVFNTPPWGVLSAIFGTALFVAVVFYVIAKFSFRTLPKPVFEVSKLVLLALMLISIAFAVIYNSYWAVFFLTLPAWIWALVGGKLAGAPRMKNRILIFAAGITFYIALVMDASRWNLMSWNFIWYQVLALSNGLFTQAAYFLATSAIAIGIRFLAIQAHEGGK
jgi:hypothetical protein